MLVGQHWCVHPSESIRIPLYFFSFASHVSFVLLGWFVRSEVGGCTVAFLWGVASSICSKQHNNILFQFPSRFFFYAFFKVQVVHLYIFTDAATAWKTSRFILTRENRFHVFPMFVVIPFSRWDIAAEVCDLVS